MAGRFVRVALTVAAVALISEAPSFACPNCRADATGLTPAAPASAEDADPFPIRLSGGADFTSAFYFRGYEQADQGPILQPYLNVFTVHTFDEDVVVKPYVSLFHSANWDSGNRMADMSDVMLGAVTTANGFALDARYAYYTMNPLMRSPVHELGAKASFDVLSLNDEFDWLQSCSLRPFVGLYGELNDGEGTEDAFLNVGLEPSWRFEVRGRKVGMSLPIDWGLSADHYYFNNDGSDARLLLDRDDDQRGPAAPRAARPVVPEHVGAIPAPRGGQRPRRQRPGRRLHRQDRRLVRVLRPRPQGTAGPGRVRCNSRRPARLCPQIAAKR
ncbi:MAG: hypothetical protein SH850_31330 [Planctomycetaceae bacterium]|nr:hypothetical protein [Planctomycetaceae bacterium]